MKKLIIMHQQHKLSEAAALLGASEANNKG
jgi:hypothetical protein